MPSNCHCSPIQPWKCNLNRGSGFFRKEARPIGFISYWKAKWCSNAATIRIGASTIETRQRYYLEAGDFDFRGATKTARGPRCLGFETSVTMQIRKQL